MGSRETKSDGRDVDRELERYREAAWRALDQLEWCINYLQSQRRGDIAGALARNRWQIVKRIR